MQCSGSGMFTPDPGSEFFHSGARIRIRIKKFKYFYPKSCFLALKNIPFVYQHSSRMRALVKKVMIRDLHPRSWITDPDLDFTPIPDPGARVPDPGVKKASDPGSRPGIPVPGSRFPDPGSRIPVPASRFPHPGSRIRILNTALKLPSAKLSVPLG